MPENGDAGGEATTRGPHWIARDSARTGSRSRSGGGKRTTQRDPIRESTVTIEWHKPGHKHLRERAYQVVQPLTAVDFISLRVYEGEFIGFPGPNGAGKFRTINMLYGPLRRPAAEIWVAGFGPAKQALEVKRRIGVLGEEPALCERLTAACT